MHTLGLIASLLPACAEQLAISAYETQKHAGFVVHVSRQAIEHPEETRAALRLLRQKLEEIARIVPSQHLQTLRRIAIWVEYDNPDFPCACYHPDANWLKQNGYDPRKENSMEIANVRNFVKWVRQDQPMMVLHELAHGYHDIVFGYGNHEIIADFRAAVQAGLYDEVKYHRGGKRSAYAKTNQMEYFAELTEAYFGVNDFFPFTYTDLQAHDPRGFKMMRRIWGEPRGRSQVLPLLWAQ